MPSLLTLDEGIILARYKRTLTTVDLTHYMIQHTKMYRQRTELEKCIRNNNNYLLIPEEIVNDIIFSYLGGNSVASVKVNLVLFRQIYCPG